MHSFVLWSFLSELHRLSVPGYPHHKDQLGRLRVFGAFSFSPSKLCTAFWPGLDRGVGRLAHLLLHPLSLISFPFRRLRPGLFFDDFCLICPHWWSLVFMRSGQHSNPSGNARGCSMHAMPSLAPEIRVQPGVSALFFSFPGTLVTAGIFFFFFCVCVSVQSLRYVLSSLSLGGIRKEWDKS